MKERPIIFSAPMVRAILAGQKTQTRRVMKHQPGNDNRIPHPINKKCVINIRDENLRSMSPYGNVGDRLWVKETIRLESMERGLSVYAADGELTKATAWPWKNSVLPSIHCPRGLSRITLEITGVRVERLQDISDADAVDEGCACDYPREKFMVLWESINATRGCWWDVNPWIWVMEFVRKD